MPQALKARLRSTLTWEQLGQLDQLHKAARQAEGNPKAASAASHRYWSLWYKLLPDEMRCDVDEMQHLLALSQQPSQPVHGPPADVRGDPSAVPQHPLPSPPCKTSSGQSQGRRPVSRGSDRSSSATMGAAGKRARGVTSPRGCKRAASAVHERAGCKQARRQRPDGPGVPHDGGGSQRGGVLDSTFLTVLQVGKFHRHRLLPCQLFRLPFLSVQTCGCRCPCAPSPPRPRIKILLFQARSPFSPHTRPPRPQLLDCLPPPCASQTFERGQAERFSKLEGAVQVLQAAVSAEAAMRRAAEVEVETLRGQLHHREQQQATGIFN